MKKIKLIYVDGRSEYMNTNETDKEILYKCTYKNLCDSFKFPTNKQDIDFSNQIKVVITGENTYLFN
jgi:hypothetical protein